MEYRNSDSGGHKTNVTNQNAWFQSPRISSNIYSSSFDQVGLPVRFFLPFWSICLSGQKFLRTPTLINIACKKISCRTRKKVSTEKVVNCFHFREVFNFTRTPIWAWTLNMQRNCAIFVSVRYCANKILNKGCIFF